MNILMLSCMFMPEVYGGAEKQCLRQAKALKERGHDVTILTAKTKDSTLLSEEMDGIPILRHNTIAQPDLLGRWSFFSLLWVIKIIKFALQNKGRFDVVHCHQGKFGIVIGAILSHIWGVPFLVKIGNSESEMDIKALAKKKFIGPKLLSYALSRKPHFIAISKVIAQNLSDFGIPSEQIHVITNGVMPLKGEYKELNPEKIKLFWHGRFEQIKNIPLLIETFVLTLKTHSNIELNLVGDGTLENILKTRVEEVGIAHKVNFIAPPENILETISDFDIFVNSSKAEGMSNSMLEAMALGKLLISTPVSGTDEIIDNGKGGYISPNHTREGLSEALSKGLTLAQKKGQWQKVYDYNVQKRHNVFDMSTIATEIEALYTEVLGK